jgi:hypothetical protein
VVGNFSFPAESTVTVVARWRSSAPYDVTSGADVSGNGLYNDRAGRPRNSGDGPAYQSISVYGHRRMALPKILSFRGKRSHVNVSIRADNVLDRPNFASYGSVVGSPLFGRPLAAAPGRSFSVGFTLDRQ